MISTVNHKVGLISYDNIDTGRILFGSIFLGIEMCCERPSELKTFSISLPSPLCHHVVTRTARIQKVNELRWRVIKVIESRKSMNSGGV